MYELEDLYFTSEKFYLDVVIEGGPVLVWFVLVDGVLLVGHQLPDAHAAHRVLDPRQLLLLLGRHRGAQHEVRDVVHLAHHVRARTHRRAPALPGAGGRGGGGPWRRVARPRPPRDVGGVRRHVRGAPGLQHSAFIF